MKLIFFAILLLGQACVSTKTSTCPPKLRAVIDMGSGATKLTMSEVELCGESPKIRNKIDLDESRAVALEAAKNSAGEIPAAARQDAVHALMNLRSVAKVRAKNLGYNKFSLSVVGTHALRTAKNRDQFIAEIQTAGFPVRALSQEEEAEAGFEAVAAASLPASCAKEDLLVWDTGGGSTQFTRADSPKPKVVLFNLGAEGFSRAAIPFRQKIKDPHPCPSSLPTPNPLGKNLNLVRRQVAKLAPVRAVALSSKNACVIGVGGVHNKAVAAQIGKYWDKIAACACEQRPNCNPTPEGYSKKELQCLAEFLSTKSQCAPEIAGPYAHTAVTNLAMVLGFMDQLEIERVHVKPVNMGDYFVLADKRLTFKEEPAE